MLHSAKESTRKKLQDWRRKKGLAPSCLPLFGFLSASCSCEQHSGNNSLPSWSSSWIPLAISPTLAEPTSLSPLNGHQLESAPPFLEVRVPVPREFFSKPPSLNNSNFFPCSPRLGGGSCFLQLPPPWFCRVLFFTFSDLVNSYIWLAIPYITFTVWFPFLTTPWLKNDYWTEELL